MGISLSPDTNCFVALELPPSRRFVSAMKFIVLIALALVGVEAHDYYGRYGNDRYGYNNYGSYDNGYGGYDKGYGGYNKGYGGHARDMEATTRDMAATIIDTWTTGRDMAATIGVMVAATT